MKHTRTRWDSYYAPAWKWLGSLRVSWQSHGWWMSHWWRNMNEAADASLVSQWLLPKHLELSTLNPYTLCTLVTWYCHWIWICLNVPPGLSVWSVELDIVCHEGAMLPLGHISHSETCSGSSCQSISTPPGHTSVKWRLLLLRHHQSKPSTYTQDCEIKSAASLHESLAGRNWDIVFWNKVLDRRIKWRKIWKVLLKKVWIKQSLEILKQPLNWL